jgi:hypothetical protein
MRRMSVTARTTSRMLAERLLMGWTGCFPRGGLPRLLRINREKQPTDATTAPLASIGIDIVKDVFHLVASAPTARSPSAARSIG